MIQLATILSPTPPSPRSNATASSIVSGEFADSFAAAGDGPGLVVPGLMIEGESDTKRQDAAVPGNALPLTAAFSIDPVARWQSTVVIAEPPLAMLPSLGTPASVSASGLASAGLANDPAAPIATPKSATKIATLVTLPTIGPQVIPRYVPTPVALPEAGKNPASAQTDAGESEVGEGDETGQGDGEQDGGQLATPLPTETAMTQPSVPIPLPMTPLVVTSPPIAAAVTVSSADETSRAAIGSTIPPPPAGIPREPRPMVAGSRTSPTLPTTKERTAAAVLAPLVQPLPGAPRVVPVAGASIADTPPVQTTVDAVAANVVRPPITIAGKAETVSPAVSPDGAAVASPRTTAGERLHAPAALPPTPLPAGTAPLTAAPPQPARTEATPTFAPVRPAASAIAVSIPVTVKPGPDGRRDTDKGSSTQASQSLPPSAVAPPAFAPAPLRSGTIASAAEVFGTAIRSAANRQTPERLGDTDARGFLTSGLSATLEVARVAETSQAPLDMRQQTWPHAMIERIEMLRDAANAVDTRIRLIPDALGPIDVSVKTSGDTVHVHFNAEQAATRALLQDAQPRLAELAEARGLKLGQGSIGSGAAGSGMQDTGQRTPTAPQPRVPSAPARAVVAATTDTDDIRIA